MPLRVLQIQGYSTGGSAEHTLQLSRGLRKRGHEVTVVCMAGNPTYVHRLRAADVETMELPLAGKGDLYSIRKIASLLRTGSFSLIHTHCRNGDFAGLLAACVTGRRVRRIATVHGLITSGGGPPRSVNERVHGFLLRHCAERVIAISEFVRRHLQSAFSIPAGRIRRVYNGSDPPEENRATSNMPAWFHGGDPYVFTYGALTPQKDHETFIKAAPLIVRRAPRARFVICGEGPDRGRLEAMVAGYGLEDHVLFAGHRDDVAFLLNRLASVVVSAAHDEGFGRVASEGMAAGKPVVAAASGAFPELIREGVTGYLFKPRDFQDLAARVSDLLENPERARTIGRAGRLNYQKRFHVDRFLENTIRLLEDLANEK